MNEQHAEEEKKKDAAPKSPWKTWNLSALNFVVLFLCASVADVTLRQIPHAVSRWADQQGAREMLQQISADRDTADRQVQEIKTFHDQSSAHALHSINVGGRCFAPVELERCLQANSSHLYFFAKDQQGNPDVNDLKNCGTSEGSRIVLAEISCAAEGSFNP